MTFEASSLEFEVGLGGGDLRFNFYVGAVCWAHTSLLPASLAGFLLFMSTLLSQRKSGLPICGSLVETTVSRFNDRLFIGGNFAPRSFYRRYKGGLEMTAAPPAVKSATAVK